MLINNVSCAEIKTIRFVVAGSYAPFARIHTAKEMSGFDIDIANEICKRAHAKCDLKNDKISNLIDSLKSGKSDAWIGGISVTEERKKDIAFSDVYFSGQAKLVATKATTFNATPIEIKGKTIGVEAGTSYISYIKEMYDDTVKIVTFPTGHDSCMALKDGKVDAVIDDAVVLEHWLLEHADRKNFRLIGLPAKHLNLINQDYAIAVAKNNLELLKTLNKTLAQIKQDGTYDELVRKHF